jgi:hypothetical protein
MKRIMKIYLRRRSRSKQMPLASVLGGGNTIQARHLLLSTIRARER